MSRDVNYIPIRGEFANSVLGTFRIIRGFATLQDLAAIPAPFPMNAGGGQPLLGHQRSIDHAHPEAIKRYLQDGRPRFIPEIILSIRVECDEVKNETQQVIGVLSNHTRGLPASSLAQGWSESQPKRSKQKRPSGV